MKPQRVWGVIVLVVVGGTLFGGCLWAMSLLVQAWSRRQLVAMPVAEPQAKPRARRSRAGA